MRSRILPIVLVAILAAEFTGAYLWATVSPAPAPLGSVCTLRYRQPGATWTNVTPVERAKDPATYYDYYSASAHTEFVEAYVSKAYFYRDTTAGRLYFFFHHNIDETGSSDAIVDFDFSALPPGVQIVVSDDPGEFQLGRSPEAQDQFWLNTDGGVLGPFPATNWSFTIAPNWGGQSPMTSWKFVDGNGAHRGLGMAKSLEVSSTCNQPPIAVAGGPYVGTEGTAIAFDAGKSSDPDGDPLTYIWDFEDDGVSDVTTTTAVVQHAYPDDFVGKAKLTVSDGTAQSSALADVYIGNVAPTIRPFGPGAAVEGMAGELSASATDPGADALTFTWEFELGSTTTETFASSGSPTTATSTVQFVYGDDGSYRTRLTVTDDDGASASWETTTEVANEPPTVKLLPVERTGNFTLRVAGEKWHDVTAVFYRDGAEIANLSVTRTPGSPDEQAVGTGVLNLSLGPQYAARVLYTPEDDPVNGQPNGANPVWIEIASTGQEPVRVHHTFNVQLPGAYVWEENLTPHLAKLPVGLGATAVDQGSDDLTFMWDFGDGTSTTCTLFNDGLAADLPKSPDGVFPFSADSTARHAFAAPGTYVITVVVTDDDGGSATTSVTVAIP